MPHRFLRWFGQGVSPWRNSPPMIENLESRELLSATYFVSTFGADTNVGSVASPFKTIQRAANVAQSGNLVDIETGTYHETVTPKNSGVTFQAYNGEKVTVSGADALGGWSRLQRADCPNVDAVGPWPGK